jgi:hypothetical protein
MKNLSEALLQAQTLAMEGKLARQVVMNGLSGAILGAMSLNNEKLSDLTLELSCKCVALLVAAASEE